MTRLRQTALVILFVSSVIVGGWAQFFPRSFYDDFPGLGRMWVSVDGPFNEHLTRDVGGLNLAIALIAGWALVTSSVVLARAAGAAALTFGVPHLIYHAAHLDDLETVDKVGNMVTLSLGVIVALIALAAPTATRSTQA